MNKSLDYVHEHTRTAIQSYQILIDNNIDEFNENSLINLSHSIYFLNNKNKLDFIENVSSITHFLCHENDSVKLNGIKFISEICVSSEQVQREIASQNGIELLFNIMITNMKNSDRLFTWSCYALCIVIYDTIDNLVRLRSLCDENHKVLRDAVQHQAWSNGWTRNYAEILNRLIGIDI
jgi:hypothetical protein